MSSVVTDSSGSIVEGSAAFVCASYINVVSITQGGVMSIANAAILAMMVANASIISDGSNQTRMCEHSLSACCKGMCVSVERFQNLIETCDSDVSFVLIDECGIVGGVSPHDNHGSLPDEPVVSNIKNPASNLSER